MATLAAATVVKRNGLKVSGALTAASTSDKFANTGKQYLLVNNGAVGAKVLTFNTPIVKSDNAGDLTVANPTVSVPAGESWLIGPFKPSLYNDSTSYVTVTVGDATSLSYKVLQFDNYGSNQ